MTSYEIMNESHIDGMAEIERLCFNSGFAEKTFRKELSNTIAYYVVALTDGKISGYGGIWNICGEADIIDIATHPDFRRMGIGQGILERLIAHCKSENCSKITLEVRKSNLIAQKLYEKNSFAVCGERKEYYRDKETALLMNLDL